MFEEMLDERAESSGSGLQGEVDEIPAHLKGNKEACRRQAIAEVEYHEMNERLGIVSTYPPFKEEFDLVMRHREDKVQQELRKEE
ncbi:hypothetical protein AnigIFM59636_002287 [Aspergillus niger]|nr:hypothetical protein AnigIFM59636_002287 [Aspergillus niger]